MKETLQRHWLALVLAIAIGTICAAPFFYFTATPQYHGIVMMGTDAEDHYLARMEEIYEGHFSIGNTYLPNKEQPYFIPSGGEIIASAVGKLFGQSVADAGMFNKFLFPLVAALALYALGYSIAGSRGAGLLGAASVLLGDGTLISGLSGWRNLLHGMSANINFLGYDRPINPEVSGLLLVLGLLLLYRIFLGRTARSWESIALTLLIGSALYVSPFIYSFLGAFLLVLFVWLIVIREKTAALRAFVIGVASLVCAIPFYLNYRALTLASGYADSALRQGAVSSHAPIIGLWLPLMLFAAVFLWPKRYAQARPLFVIAALALLVLLNQQIISGHILQPGHYHWYITIPLAFIMLSLYAAYIIERFLLSRPWRVGAFALGIGVFAYSATLTQIHSYQAWLPTASAAQAYEPILETLGAIPGEQVVWANPDISSYIPIYTKDDAPGSVQILNYLVPLSYLEERAFLFYRLQGLTAAEAPAAFSGNQRANLSSAMYGLYWLEQTGSFTGIPDTIVSKIARDYQQQYTLPMQVLFQKLGITMIVWDTAADPEWHIDTLPFVTQVGSSGSLRVYKIND